MADKAEKIREKQGSVELDLDFKQVYLYVFTASLLSIGFMAKGFAGLIYLTVPLTVFLFLKKTERYDGSGLVGKFTNLLVFVLILPVYPFKKMLDYRDATETQEKQ